MTKEIPCIGEIKAVADLVANLKEQKLVGMVHCSLAKLVSPAFATRRGITTDTVRRNRPHAAAKPCQWAT
jgi:hypothetical protein